MPRPPVAILGPLFALLLVMAAQPACAEDPLTVVFGFDREFPPFTYEQDGEATGFDVDVAKAALYGRNVNLVFRPMSWERVQTSLSAGTIQLTSGMAKTRQRGLIYRFVDRSHASLGVKLFTKTRSRVPSAAKLRGMTVAVHKGSLYQRVLEEFGGLNLKLYPTDLDALKALYNDETEAYGGGDKTAYFYLRRLEMEDIAAIGASLTETKLYFAAHRDEQKLVGLMNAGLRAIHESGEYDAIYRKWFVQELTPNERQTLLDEAKMALDYAYAPYTRRPQGAAVLTQSGKVFGGSVIENADLGETVSALRVAVYRAVASGETELRAAVSVDAEGRALPPAAEERQLLREFGRGVLALMEPEDGSYITRTAAQLLPFPPQGREADPSF